MEYQAGGLAQMAQMRGRPQRQRSRVPTGSPGMANRMRAAVPTNMMPRGNDMRRPTPQMMQQMRQRRGGRSPMGQVTRTPMRGPMQQIQPAGGQDPRRMQDAMNAARMPGGRAAPMRGMLQKMQAQQRMTPGGNRVGMRDQQGGLHRAMQAQTGRPPISRRAAFPGSRTNQY